MLRFHWKNIDIWTGIGVVQGIHFINIILIREFQMSI